MASHWAISRKTLPVGLCDKTAQLSHRGHILRQHKTPEQGTLSPLCPIRNSLRIKRRRHIDHSGLCSTVAAQSGGLRGRHRVCNKRQSDVGVELVINNRNKIDQALSKDITLSIGRRSANARRILGWTMSK